MSTSVSSTEWHGHGLRPTDALGRFLPDAGWPEHRAAPGRLEFVRRFCNTTNAENGAERFVQPGAVDDWLRSEGAPPIGADPLDLARLLALRSTVRRLVIANSTPGTDAAPEWSALDLQCTRVGVGFAFADADLALVSTGSGCDELVARIALAVAVARYDQTWPRLKACARCEWVVFDTSKNRNSRWCSMSACGSRHNASQYRRRLRSDAPASSDRPPPRAP